MASNILANVNQPRYEDITETTGVPVSPEGASMLYTRYALAASLSRGRRVIELGCAAGQGLGLLERVAARVVAADYSPVLLRSGQRHYGSRIPFVRLTAEALPFRDHSFDVALMFEASYYVPDMGRAFDEMVRILAPGGTVLFVNANPERPDFIASPHSVHYHTADEFRRELVRRGLTVTVEGAYQVMAASPLTRWARRALSALGLVPKTLRGRARIKRLLYRSLPSVPAELPEHFAEIASRTALQPGPAPGYKVIYVTGTCASG